MKKYYLTLLLHKRALYKVEGDTRWDHSALTFKLQSQDLVACGAQVLEKVTSTNFATCLMFEPDWVN